MRILFIATANPFIRSGGGIANFSYYKVLDNIYPNCVDLVMACNNIVKHETIENLLLVPNRSKLDKFFSLITGNIHRYKSFVSELLKKENYDICFINGGHYAGDMIDLLHSYGLKVIVMNHNFEREYQSTVRINKLFKYLYLYFVVHNERNSYKKADANCFITNDDKLLFEKSYGITNSIKQIVGVFDPYTENIYTYGKKRKQFTVVISGSVNEGQTIDGIRDFHDKYWHLLKEIVPDVKLIITGRNADNLYAIFPDFNSSDVEIIPNPEDIYEIVSQAHLYLCPINVGGGLKLRVMDGLKLGIPVLVHSVSARGYDAFYSKPYFQIYNDEPSFIDGLEKLLNIIDIYYDSSCIRKNYSEEFGLNKGVAVFSKLFNQLLGKQSKIGS